MADGTKKTTGIICYLVEVFCIKVHPSFSLCLFGVCFFSFRDQLFGDGFSVPVLRRLAVLMERQEQPVATVVRCKGAAVQEVRPIR